MSNRVSVDPEAGTITGVRKLRKSGNSTVLTIPQEVLDAVGFESGERVAIIAEMQGDSLTIKSPDTDAEE